MFTTNQIKANSHPKNKNSSTSSSDDDGIDKETNSQPATRMTASHESTENSIFCEETTASADKPSTSKASQNSSMSKMENQKNNNLNSPFDELQRDFADMQAKIANLQKEVDRLTPQDSYPKEFFFEDTDLLKIHGRNPQKYALQIANTIFSRRELATGVFLDPTTPRKTDRERLDESRIDILQRNYLKYEL